MRKKLVGILSAVLAAAIMATPVSAANLTDQTITIQGVNLTGVTLIVPESGTYKVDYKTTKGAAVLFFGVKGVYTDADVTSGKLTLLNTNLVQISDTIADASGNASATFGLKELGLTAAAPIATIFVSGGELATPKVAGYVNGTDGTNGKVAWGDLNEDGKIQPIDATWVMQIYVKQKTPLDHVVKAGVVSSKTQTSPKPIDATYIMRKYIKAIDKFIVEQ